jgi:chaperonin cofactor prefoldin
VAPKKEKIAVESKAQERVKELSSELENQFQAMTALTKENETLRAEKEELEMKIENLAAEIATLNSQLADYKKIESKLLDIDPDMSGYLKIVAVPDNDQIVVQRVKRFGDRNYYGERDEHGFFTWTLPRESAIALLRPGAGGIRHLLIGPDDTLTFDVVSGLYKKPYTVQRHAKNVSDSGRVSWVPVEVEESK